MKRLLLLTIVLVMLSASVFSGNKKSSVKRNPELIISDEITKCETEIRKLERVILRIEASCRINRSSRNFPLEEAKLQLQNMRLMIAGLEKKIEHLTRTVREINKHRLNKTYKMARQIDLAGASDPSSRKTKAN